MKSGELVGLWKGWFFEVSGVGGLARGGRVVRPGAGVVVEGAIAAGIGVTARRIRVTSGRIWWTNSARISRSSVITASIARRYGVGIGNVNVVIVRHASPTPIAAPVIVIVVDQRTDEHPRPKRNEPGSEQLAARISRW